MPPDPQAEAVAFLAAQADAQLCTHASRIFLSGETAWKLKRAIRFSFLDYSTLAQRQQFCTAEVALNRRTAPALYRGVRFITRAVGGGLEWDGPGEAVDVVVDMRRFPQEALLTNAPLTPALMRALADTIAAFHAGAEIIAGPDKFSAILEGNAENLRQICPGTEPLIAALNAAYTSVAPLLAARAAGAKIRRCHGDLHLGNIVLQDGAPVLFDAIEFSDDFSCIDVLYDLAFLLMDLLHRAEPGLASKVFNRYLDLTDESDGLKTLPLFLATRAQIRAFVLGAQGKPADTYLTLARGFLTPTAPRLIALGGLSGTGKSTLAASLAPRFAPAPGARVLRTDVIRKRLHGVAPENRLPETAYTAQKSAQTYAALHAQARAALHAGYTVILDAAFLCDSERRAAEALAADCGVPFTGLWLHAAPETLAARLAARHNDASDAGPDLLPRQQRAVEPEQKWPRLDTARPLSEQSDAAYAFIDPVSIKR